MSRLSIFVDESGDFGPYEPHSPFYLFTLVFHDQEAAIADQIKRLENGLVESGLSAKHCFHAGPIIRREEDYQNLSIADRRKLLNRVLTFAKHCDISYVTVCAEKKHISDSLDLTVKLSRQLNVFVRENYDFFNKYDNIVVYYDNGQVELNKLLASVFSVLFSNVEFRKVLPANYRLFQVADLFCTLELTNKKYEQHILSKSDEGFLGSIRDFKKNYYKPMLKKRHT